MRKMLTIFSSACLILAAGNALAGKDTRSLSELDANNDGQISQEEAQQDKTIARNFKVADVDNSGSLTRSEYIRAVAAGRGSESEESAEE